MGGSVQIGLRSVGEASPCYVIAEIGLNHNGDLGMARQLMDVAAGAGCDAVKFQKRTPRICVPEHQQPVLRETPWGTMTYLEYRERLEFGVEQFDAIDAHARELGIPWFASAWDVPSVEFIERYEPPCYKVASASLTDDELLGAIATTGRPVILSTGMSTLDQVRHAVGVLDGVPLLIARTTSTYPCPPAELNLRMIHVLGREFDVPIGYSGHETGLQTTVAAVVLGACFVERHITMDRSLPGSDHAASVEPQGLQRLVRDIRTVEVALGDGIKQVYESELPVQTRLRRIR